MKKVFVSAAALVALALISSPAVAQLKVAKRGPQAITLNKKIRKNTMEWLSEAPMENIKGSAPGVTGTFTVDPADLTKTTGKITVPVKGMKTGNPIRDGHLQGAEWLDSKKYPNVTFEIRKVSACRVDAKKGNKAKCKVAGTFTCHGVGKAVTTDVEISWKTGNAKTARKAPGDWIKIKTKFVIALGDYKVKGKSGVVGNKVGKTIKIWGSLYGNTK